MQTRAREAPASPSIVAVIGLTLIGAYVAITLILIDRTSFDVWGGVLLTPVLVALTVPALRRQAVREADPQLFRLLLLALAVKLAGAAVRYYVAFSVYSGQDASRYHNAGVALADPFRHLNFTGVDLKIGTAFMENMTGAVYALIGPSKLGGFVFFSWLGFWGLFLFYRAFTIAVPLGRPRSYAHLLFFLPSLVFWPSSIGKESWMMWTLGIVVYGAAKILVGETWRGSLICAPGLWLAGMVRPHIAALVVVSLAMAVIIRKSKTELRELAPIVKGGSIVIITVLAVILAVRTNRYLQDSGIDTSGGTTSTFTELQDRTSEGGSVFNPSIVESPVTVLFRPFVFETHNLQSLVAAIEGTALMVFCVLRFRWGWAALRSLRRQPYVAFCLVFSLLFVVAHSSIANFGILTRQRVQLYPLFLVLFSIPPALVGRSTRAHSAHQTAPVVIETAQGAPSGRVAS